MNSFEQQVRDLLLKHDPLCAVSNPLHQRDKYDLELPQVMKALEENLEFEPLRHALWKIFRETGGGILEAGNVLRYSDLTQELISLRDSTIG